MFHNLVKLLNIGAHNLESNAKGVGREANPFDGGATFSHPTQPAPTPQPPSTIPQSMPTAEFSAGYQTAPGLEFLSPHIFTDKGVPYYKNPGNTLTGAPGQHNFSPAMYPAVPLYTNQQPIKPLGLINNG